MLMKSFRQYVKSAAHHGLRWFVRLRVWGAVAFVLGFGVYELTRVYRSDLASLPGAVWQDASDWIDDAVWGETYLEKDTQELKAQADAGNAFAMYVYALRHTTRPPVEVRISPADPKVARDYYAKSAQAGFVRAQAVMALYLYRGMGGPADPVQAKVFAELATAKQDPLGMRMLADILLDEAKKTPGGNPAVELRGCRLLIKAADRGNRGALRKLGDLTAEGRIGFTDEKGNPILVQNFGQALAYYEQAALMRDYEASQSLAAAHEENKITPTDLVKAYGWNLVAAQLATKPEEVLKLKAKLMELSTRMSPADLIAAHNVAKDSLQRMPTDKEDAARSLLKAR